MTIRSYQELIVWKKATDLAVAVFALTEYFPADERFGLSQQMRRAAVSIPSNIAEGWRRGTRREYIRFLRMSFGSGAELETQVIIAKRLTWFDNVDSSIVERTLNEVLRLLNAMIVRL